MSRKIENCRTPTDFIHHAQHNGGYIDRQCGSHVVVKAPNGGICVVPNHPGELGKGLRCKIIKQLIAIGLGALALLWLFEPAIEQVIRMIGEQ